MTINALRSLLDASCIVECGAAGDAGKVGEPIMCRWI
jgi:hypothetical protein